MKILFWKKFSWKMKSCAKLWTNKKKRKRKKCFWTKKVISLHLLFLKISTMRTKLSQTTLKIVGADMLWMIPSSKMFWKPTQDLVAYIQNCNSLMLHPISSKIKWKMMITMVKALRPRSRSGCKRLQTRSIWEEVWSRIMSKTSRTLWLSLML